MVLLEKEINFEKMENMIKLFDRILVLLSKSTLKRATVEKEIDNKYKMYMKNEEKKLLYIGIPENIHENKIYELYTEMIKEYEKNPKKSLEKIFKKFYKNVPEKKLRKRYLKSHYEISPLYKLMELFDINCIISGTKMKSLFNLPLITIESEKIFKLNMDCEFTFGNDTFFSVKEITFHKLEESRSKKLRTECRIITLLNENGKETNISYPSSIIFVKTLMSPNKSYDLVSCIHDGDMIYCGKWNGNHIFTTWKCNSKDYAKLLNDIIVPFERNAENITFLVLNSNY